ncbi:MAG TPA: L-aspartate oxidase [Acidobacteriaceae bacterium]|nr:L-aspartate oxidase [Acidobacteriaceae bacterium]
MGETDFLVIGAGIAGLRAAVGLSEAGKVLVITKEALGESNTAYAQGGIAVAMEGDEDTALHLEDTITAGDGLVNRGAAAVLVEEGRRRVEELLAWGTAFDREHGELMRTREGAHSRSRILHAHGDATGREIAVSLLRQVRGLKNVELCEWTTTVDLIVESGRVVGARLLDARGTFREVRAGAVLLASGGAGQVYSETTNPPVATGDGIAMAYRAGAELMDMEFMQFHPTAFALPGAPRFLISEALRGEGACLVNAQGERFMQRYDPRMELAPRDIVARAIAKEALGGPVYLDMRAVAARLDLKARFPGISAFLAQYDLKLARDLIPVLPAAHYLMGGVRTDTHGRTSLRGLYAAGECACTGVHGANRLASNSLLEGLVFGARAAKAMKELPVGSAQFSQKAAESDQAGKEACQLAGAGGGAASARPSDADLERWIERLRELMWLDAGLLRNRKGLQRALAELATLGQTMWPGDTRREIEARNLHTLAEIMVQCALAREESRGAHFRTDFPAHADVARHSLLRAGVLRFENA